jgi:hypothetical protein
VIASFCFLFFFGYGALSMVRIDTRGSKQGGLIKVMESKSKGHVDGYTDKKRQDRVEMRSWYVYM